MSTPSPPAEAPTNKLNKLELFSDFLSFASIVSAFLFLSTTLRYNLFEAFFSFTLSSANEIVLFYLLYSLLIVILKSIAAVIRLAKKEDTELSKELDSAVSRSLFAVSFIVTVHILAAEEQSPAIGVAELCQISIWLLVAELNLIFCGLLKKVGVMQSLQLFGWTIEAILVGGQLVRWLFAFDFFNIL